MNHDGVSAIGKYCADHDDASASFAPRGCPETGIHHRGTEITENKPLILRLLDLCVSVVRID
jgi:hypothetical protein